MKAGVLSGTSTCHTFDSSADGYGRGDGIGALYLKRLNDAIRDGDPIRSVIRASAINANGKTPGITLPSANGQEAVIRKAYAKAGIGFSETAYVECHGTGTKVGDVIEVEALSRVFKRPAHSPLLIGSTNVGHSEAASGISSVIKTTLALEKSLIPGTVGLNQINPKLKTTEWNISIPTTLTPWPAVAEFKDHKPIRRASINSFGYGGANAHVILENADAHVPLDYDVASKAQHTLCQQSFLLLPFSAATRESLDARVKDFVDFDFHDVSALDLAHTLGSRRTHFAKRGYMLLQRNVPINDGLSTQTLRTLPSAVSNGTSRYAFVFTGQGSQWPEMCKELFSEFPVFRDAVSDMDCILQSLPHPPTWTLREAILENSATSLIHHPTRSQPACTAIQVALVQLFASWGISPSATIGHSSGEIAAAFAAGYLSTAAAITIAYYRGYVVGKHVSNGAMIAAGLSENTATAEILLAGLHNKIQVACINSPESVTISGDKSAIDTLFGILQERNIFVRKLRTGGQAYHSHHMRALGQEYQDLLERAFPYLDVSKKLPTTAIFISSVTAELQTSDLDSAYWRSNLESPVLFANALERLDREEGHFHLIELGPHSALELPIKQIRSKLGTAADTRQYSAAIKRNTDSLKSVLSLAGSLWLHGHDVSFERINGMHSGGKMEIPGQKYKVLHNLPSYRWHYDDVLWNECRTSVEFRQRKYPRHELLGSQMPGANGLDTVWRNVLRVDDISWLKDHKLEETVVFPGAGYVSMAMEAVLQSSGSKLADRPTFRLENVNILTALALSVEPAAQVELFTIIRRSPITYTSNSDSWWEFNISSFQGRVPVAHASGSISIRPTPEALVSKYQAPADCLEPSAPKMWYEKLAKQGLNFGPTFQSIQEFQVSRMKSVRYCTTKAPLLQTCGDDWSPYAIHPITLDAMLQTSIVATTAGNSKDLRAKVPTRIGVAVIETPETSICPASIHSLAESVGFGTVEIGAELINSNGRVNVQIENVRLAPYEVTNQVRDAEIRHPMLRVLWKPDIYGLGLIGSNELSDYLDQFAQEASSEVTDKGLLKLGAVLSLLAHKNPGMRILELGNDITEITKATLDLLHANTAFRWLRSYTVGSILENGELVGANITVENGERQAISPIIGQTFDLILLPFFPTADVYLKTRFESLRNLMHSESLVLALSSSPFRTFHSIQEMDVVQCGLSNNTGEVILARMSKAIENHNASIGHHFVVIDQGSNPLSEAIMKELSKVTSQPITRLAMNEVEEKNIIAGATVFSLIECQQPILVTATDDEMHRIKLITDNASTIVWVTGGNFLEGANPNFALISGIARALVLEQPSLQFFTFDIDDVYSQVQQTAEHLISVLSQRDVLDMEFVQRRGVVHVSRFVPDHALNDSFRQKQGTETVTIPLQEAKPARLSIERTRQFDTIFFKQMEPQKHLDATAVQVQVMSVGLNAKDFYVLAGKVDTKNATCSLEFCGVVEKVGSAVSSLAPGDRVVVMAPGHFETLQVVPEWACQKLKDHEDFNTLSTLPVVYATALYALQDRANLRPGETVLIHSGAGGVGIAAIQIAQLSGAKVFTTVSTEAKKDYLVKTFGINAANIFSSRDDSFVPGILKATSGKGVDVVLNSLTGDLLHAGWRCCASFGRFVEIGKLDLTSAGKLEMDQFLKNGTFTAFDMSNLYNSNNPVHHALWSKLLTEVLRLYRANKIMKIEPLQVFDVSEFTQALRYFSSRNRMGKVAINLENNASVLRVQPFKYNTTFSPGKSYIMIGCLGGLGRSLSKWMLTRGARKFIFLGRSGLDKAPARRLIEDLEHNGADCKVVRGNVCNQEHVKAVIDQVDGLVGGVIQAAMGLNESLFTTMSNEHWHTGIDPKVIGTWNLHNSIRGKDSELEFFLMTSSISGTVGTATESNYCSANYFLDVFARYRRTLGLPATSIGLGMISEVGYLHENPEIEALLLRKGIQAINEDELLQIVDIALSSHTTIPHAYDGHAHAHILTGLEPFGLKELRKKGFEGTNPTLNDPRAAVLAAALDGQADVAYKNQDGNLPAEVADALEKGMLLADAVSAHVSKRFGNLVLLPLAQVDVSKPLADYGMDSMIAAEFRTWFFKSFRVDIPFLTLLSKTSTVRSLSEAALELISIDCA
ncbi:MAG: hypothetical protein Q9187_000159 [Circinaria calcarea]